MSKQIAGIIEELRQLIDDGKVRLDAEGFAITGGRTFDIVSIDEAPRGTVVHVAFVLEERVDPLDLAASEFDYRPPAELVDLSFHVANGVFTAAVTEPDETPRLPSTSELERLASALNKMSPEILERLNERQDRTTPSDGDGGRVGNASSG